MITIKSPREIETMAAAGHIVAATLALVARHVRPGSNRWNALCQPPQQVAIRTESGERRGPGANRVWRVD